jgi:hypothetical protein
LKYHKKYFLKLHGRSSGNKANSGTVGIIVFAAGRQLKTEATKILFEELECGF